VAGLTVLDRLIVALHRAGAGPIYVVCGGEATYAPGSSASFSCTCAASLLRRTKALEIPVQVLSEIPPRDGLVLVARSEVIVRAADLALLIERGGRLATAAGAPLPIGILPHLPESAFPKLDSLSVVRAEGFAALMTDARSARVVERALWASLTSSADGVVDRVFNRPCGRALSKLLVHTNVSPNTISVASILIGLLAAWLFAAGDYASIVAAAFIFQLSAIVDCVDGDLARVLFKESKLGKWLDLAGDQVVHVGVFAGMAIGLARREIPLGLWLGMSAVVGALLSFAVVLRGMRNRDGRQSVLMGKLIDSVTNRDFSVLVLVLACIDRLQWFLWLAAVGSHVFWIAALAIQGSTAGRRVTR